jgi:hypothetical protein
LLVGVFDRSGDFFYLSLIILIFLGGFSLTFYLTNVFPFITGSGSNPKLSGAVNYSFYSESFSILF